MERHSCSANTMSSTFKSVELRLAAIAAAACLLPIGLWAFQFAAPKFSDKYEEWAHFGSYVGGVISPVLAFAGFIGLLFTIRQQRSSLQRQQQDRDDAHFFEHAVKCLERAYDTISDQGASATPLHDRLAWLTCARLLLAARQSAEQISLESNGLRIMYAGETEHARHRFYELFQPFSGSSFANSEGYFLRDATDSGAPIEERSIRVIYDFMKWPDDLADPIGEVPLFTLEEAEKMGLGRHGLRAYVKSRARFSQPGRQAPL